MLRIVLDDRQTSLASIAGWIRDCGYHCSGKSVPEHICYPMEQAEGSPHHMKGDHTHGGHPGGGAAVSAPPMEHMHHSVEHVHHHRGEGAQAPHAPVQHEHRHEHAGHPVASAEHAHEGHMPLGMHEGHKAQEMMGHGGHHGGMSMQEMVRDMRNRFLVAAVLSVVVMLFSPMRRGMLGFSPPAPFGLRDDVIALVLSLPVVFYTAWIFFDGAYRALRARTLDMMVLVAIAVGAGWLYRVGVTLAGGGEVFYEAATVLTAFVLLGHWFEMRARGGANDALRTLLELAPPVALVIRDGEPVEAGTRTSFTSHHAPYAVRSSMAF